MAEPSEASIEASINPFELDDKEESSNEDLENLFDSANVDALSLFDFGKWLNEFKLTDIEECFVDHGMIDLITLDMNTENFKQLISDTRVLTKPHLIPVIVNAIQSLQGLQAAAIMSMQDAANDLSDMDMDKAQGGVESVEGAIPETTKPSKALNASKSASFSPHIKSKGQSKSKPKRKRLIFMTQQENMVFKNIQQNIKKLHQLKQSFETVLAQSVQDTQAQNTSTIQQYTQFHNGIIDAIETKIHSQFEEIHGAIDETNKSLQDTMNRFDTQLYAETTKHKDVMQEMDGRLKKCQTIVEQDLFQFKDIIARCKKIVEKHDKQEQQESSQQQNSFLNVNRERENEIMELGRMADAHFEKRAKMVDANQRQILQYNKTEMQLVDTPLFSLNVDQNVYDSVCDAIRHKLVSVTCNAPPPPLRAKLPPNDARMQQLLHDDVDDIPQILIVDDEDDQKEEPSISVANVAIGAERDADIEGKDEGDDDEADADADADDDDAKVNEISVCFKHFNAEKWESAENGTVLKAKEYNVNTFYCVYLSSTPYSTGIHSICVKGVKSSDNFANIKCCIGVHSEMDPQWIQDGMNAKWPSSKGVSSFFDGVVDDHGWYSNEVIRIKLDMDELMVYYYSTYHSKSKGKQTAIKQEKLKPAKQYYFLMCAESDPLVEYC